MSSFKMEEAPFPNTFQPRRKAQAHPADIVILMIVTGEGMALNRNDMSLHATPGTIALQAPLSMRFSRQGYWSGLPFPPAGDLPNPKIEPGSPALQADSLLAEPPGKPPCSF